MNRGGKKWIMIHVNPIWNHRIHSPGKAEHKIFTSTKNHHIVRIRNKDTKAAKWGIITLLLLQVQPFRYSRSLGVFDHTICTLFVFLFFLTSSHADDLDCSKLQPMHHEGAFGPSIKPTLTMRWKTPCVYAQQVCLCEATALKWLIQSHGSLIFDEPKRL